eukprot:TRINITY_DN8189_c0_g1_i4.p1 TRINITY_DN8189_c0_g1~~TRINITY_DN8189_c0_g1_i4.p1  ORF type:complete len:746 (+),score=32.84 TRINITY_DN8189_c0_g1_i4:231-2240(+)
MHIVARQNIKQIVWNYCSRQLGANNCGTQINNRFGGDSVQFSSKWRSCSHPRFQISRIIKDSIMTTFQGFNLKCSEDNKILSYNRIQQFDKTFVKISSLQHRESDYTIQFSKNRYKIIQKGTQLYVGNNQGYPHVFTIDRDQYDWGWLVGWVVGDGCDKGSRGQICYYEEDLQQETQKIAWRAFEIIHRLKTTDYYQSRIPTKPCYQESQRRYSIDSKKIALLCEGIVKSGCKSALPQLEHLSYSFLRGFVQGFFAADGSIWISRNFYSRLSNTNLHNLNVVQRILQRYGIMSSITQTHSAGLKRFREKNYQTKNVYQLGIFSMSQQIFYKLFSFGCDRKHKLLEQLLQNKVSKTVNKVSHFAVEFKVRLTLYFAFCFGLVSMLFFKVAAISLLALLVGLHAQPLVCYNPPIITDPFAIQRNVSDLLPLVEEVKQKLAVEVEGLSVEEIAPILPDVMASISREMFLDILAEAGDDVQDLNPTDMIVGGFQAVLENENTFQAFDLMLEDPENFVRFFDLVIGMLNLTCMEDPVLQITTVLYQNIVNLLQEPFIDNAEHVMNASFVILSQKYGLADDMVDFLKPLVASLDAAESAEGALASLLSFATDDVITAALASAMKAVDLDVIANREAMTQVITVSFQKIQEGLGLDPEDFITFISRVAKNILEALD